MSHTETDWTKQHTHGGTDCPGGEGCPVLVSREDVTGRHTPFHSACDSFHFGHEDCPKELTFEGRIEAAQPTFNSADEAFDAVKDSGERRSWDTGSVRDLAVGKGRYDLLPPYSIKRIAQHFENGAVKYGDRNWELGQPLSCYIDSALRHGFNVSAGMHDEDHASAAAWNWMAFMHTAEKVRLGELPAELDDIGWNKVEDMEVVDRSALPGRCVHRPSPSAQRCKAEAEPGQPLCSRHFGESLR